MLIGELVSGTCLLEVSVIVVKVVCAKALFLTVTVVMPEKLSIVAEVDQSVKV